MEAVTLPQNTSPHLVAITETPALGGISMIEGDATQPVSHGLPIILAHICNNQGFWGKGFVTAISKRWQLPEEAYRASALSLFMGMVQFVIVTPTITVANMIAQGHPHQPVPIRYEALRTALQKVAAQATLTRSEVHMPKIGTGLARGDWKIISAIIEQELCSKGVDVYVYEHSQAN